MNILAVDTSAKCASAAVWADGIIKAEFFANNGLTHSQTVMPMIDAVLKCAGVTVNEIDNIAVTNGPGSFTGVRIGVAAVKGLAQPNSIPCTGVSTLLACAHNMSECGAYVCVLMDARRNQFYTALFKSNGESIERVTPDTALSADDLKKLLSNYNSDIFLVGDGAVLWYNYIKEEGALTDNIKIAPKKQLLTRAGGVAEAALPVILSGDYQSAAALKIEYLRLPQAERELLKKAKE